MSQRLSTVVRRKFIDFFTQKHGHTFVPSSPVKPKDDPTLEFINAGMNQFKPLILADLASYSPSRICNYQKCIRIGGKMCDLNTIGHDLTHHTFFEMLGNWSLNDYGKEQACEWALDFLVNDLNLDRDRLKITYHANDFEEDVETREIWTKKLGLPSDQVESNRDGDNFWEMGPSGPCGMSTEIYYPADDSLLEIWNLVFIDRQRLADNPTRIVPLKSKFVDTGMGLERIVSVLDNKKSNYDTDLFIGLFDAIQKKSASVEPYRGTLSDELDVNYRILADHCRMITMALADGIEPGRKGAEFYLRSIIKKCILISRDVFHQETPRYLVFDLVDVVIDVLGDAYPELRQHVKMIRRVISSESKRYLLYMERSQASNERDFD